MRVSLAILGLSLVACTGSQPKPAGEVDVESYLVRGVVAQLPSGPGTEFMISHEAIPQFVGASGDTVGMNSMTMGFPAAAGVSLKGFDVGDSVEFRFEVRWNGSPPLRMISIQKR